MKTSHTVGPWRTVVITTAKTVIRRGHDTICEVHRTMGSPSLMDREGEGDANARLIASAPSLLEALETLLESSSKRAVDVLAAQEQAHAAIRRARGINP